MKYYHCHSILIFGLGKTGLSLIRYFTKKNTKAYGIDENIEKKNTDNHDCKANLFYGNSLDFIEKLPDDLDMIIVSPGIDKKHVFFKHITKRYPNIIIIGEIEFLHRLITIPWIAVTGTDGKSTVSDLLRFIFSQSGYRVFLGGNFGIPLAELILHQKEFDIAVIELSSFQLEDVTDLNPNVSIITNIAPDHLYRHHTLTEYVRCKTNIFISQSQQNTAVLDFDPNIVNYADKTQAQIRWISLNTALEQNFDGCYFSKDESLYHRISHNKDSTFFIHNEKLMGNFQPQNFMAAFEAAKHFQLSDNEIIQNIQNYHGLSHRIEFVRELSGIRFYNDSKATNIHAMTSAIASFNDQTLYVIAGGKDKGESLDPLIKIGKEKIKTIYLIGECSEKFEKILSHYYHCQICHTLENAVLMAYKKANSHSVILFSPGAASFDQYKDFNERGNHFKTLVLGL